MADRIAVISGVTGGIGRALAEGFTAAGYAVTGLDRADSSPAQPGRGTAHGAVAGAFVRLDITDSAAVTAFGATLDRVDVLVNTAGIIRRVEEFEIAVFEDVLDINLTGTMRLATACRPALAKAGGAIINIASMLSFFGGGLVPAYSASKGGLAQLTKSLAIAWAKDGIRVNALAPGWIATAMTEPLRRDEARNRTILERTPMARWGTPEDLVGPALFLASDAARFVTGAILPVDGGYSVM
jgi:NAD(P)-dependent dehydrogenase (short-subunit alcohol dehydrogenase family)